LKHFYCHFKDANDLWNQFNKELERLETADFKEFKWEENRVGGRNITQGDKSVYVEKGDNLTINIQ